MSASAQTMNSVISAIGPKAASLASLRSIRDPRLPAHFHNLHSGRTIARATVTLRTAGRGSTTD